MDGGDMTGNNANLILPTFLMIGAARSGTTTWYSCLQQHPEIFLPASKRPEPHFFLKEAEYCRGLEYYSQRYFAAGQQMRVRGEASTSYICHDWVAQRIKQHLPDVKLLVMLRNPVDRAFSNYWHTVKSGLEKESFDDALRLEEQRAREAADPFLRTIRPFAYVERGYYCQQLRHYLRFFPPEQLQVFLLDDWLSDPLAVLRKTFAFLGVEGSFVPANLNAVENQSTPPDLTMSAAARAYLDESYRAEIVELAALLKRDLSLWLKAA
jgi:hypothetical protein